VLVALMRISGLSMTEADPIVGIWYEHLDKDQKFEIIEIDKVSRHVEIQYFDGDLDMIDLDEWYELDIEPIEPPEDWTGPVDDIERDDLGYTETDMDAAEWSDPLIGKGRMQEDAELDEEESDEWGEGSPEEEPWQEED